MIEVPEWSRLPTSVVTLTVPEAWRLVKPWPRRLRGQSVPLHVTETVAPDGMSRTAKRVNVVPRRDTRGANETFAAFGCTAAGRPGEGADDEGEDAPDDSEE